MGVHPYNSTLALIATHRPLTQYLGRALGREVEFYTAPDFDSYYDALQAGEYDLAICPPHFALLAKSYLPLLHYQVRLEPVLAVRADSPLRTVEDFRGKRIAMADRTAFIRLVMVKWLEDHGLRAGIDYQVVEKPSHGAAIAAVTLGEADAGLATTTTLRQVPRDVQQQLRAVSAGLTFPHVVTVVNRRLGAPLTARIRSALLAFHDADEGRQFFAALGVGGYEDLDEAELRQLRPYADYYLKLKQERAR
jgi:phosphonate transport system substrate-binding protein